MSSAANSKQYKNINISTWDTRQLSTRVGFFLAQQSHCRFPEAPQPESTFQHTVCPWELYCWILLYVILATVIATACNCHESTQHKTKLGYPFEAVANPWNCITVRNHSTIFNYSHSSPHWSALLAALTGNEHWHIHKTYRTCSHKCKAGSNNCLLLLKPAQSGTKRSCTNAHTRHTMKKLRVSRTHILLRSGREIPYWYPSRYLPGPLITVQHWLLTA